MKVKIKEDAITIKWNSERMFFEAFMPNGEKLPTILSISISDNFGKEKRDKAGPLIATIEAIVNIE